MRRSFESAATSADEISGQDENEYQSNNIHLSSCLALTLSHQLNLSLSIELLKTLCSHYSFASNMIFSTTDGLLKQFQWTSR